MPNTVSQIKEFFSTEERPIKAAEMMQFWKSLSPEDKEYYQNADLS